jgi:hypothetical protein
LNGNPITGATSTSYLWTPTKEGTYSIFMTAEDTLQIPIDSNTIVAQVNTLPWINISTSTYTLNMSQSCQLSSSYGGGAPPYSIQWYLNGNPIPDATSQNYLWIPTNEGTYSIIATLKDSYNVTSSSTSIQVTVTGPPIVNISTSTTTLEVGQLATLAASVTGGTLPYSNYQWYLNGSAITGATSSSYTFTPDNGGTYDITVTVQDTLNATASSNLIVEIVTSPPSKSLTNLPLLPMIIVAVVIIILVVIGGAMLILRRRSHKKQKST